MQHVITERYVQLQIIIIIIIIIILGLSSTCPFPLSYNYMLRCHNIIQQRVANFVWHDWRMLWFVYVTLLQYGQDVGSGAHRPLFGYQSSSQGLETSSSMDCFASGGVLPTGRPTCGAHAWYRSSNHCQLINKVVLKHDKKARFLKL